MRSVTAQQHYFRLACALGMTAVIAGAFGAHQLESQLDADHLAYWQTAVEYNFYHALALLAFAGAAVVPGVSSRTGLWACRAWVSGIAIFSGTLYLLAVTGQSWLGAITPVGGLALIAGWLLAGISVARS